MARDVAYYQGLVPPLNAGKPKFQDTIAFLVDPEVANQQTSDDLQTVFDLDVAVGVQLDKVGQWVGVTRYTSAGILDDDYYRLLLRARIIVNNYDGTNIGAVGNSAIQAAYQSLLTTSPTYIIFQDNQDMEMIFGISGVLPSSLFLALCQNGDLPIKPAGVRMYFSVTTVDGAPLFGLDVENEKIAGLDVGAWGAPNTYI